MKILYLKGYFLICDNIPALGNELFKRLSPFLLFLSFKILLLSLAIISRLIHCKNSSILQYSFPCCRLIFNRITFGIFSNIIGIKSDPTCSCCLPNVFKALTLLSIRSYNSYNSVIFEPFTLFNFINSFICVEIMSWGFPYLSFKNFHA